MLFAFPRVKQVEGGVDRTILTCTANETTVGEDKNETLDEDQTKNKPKPTKQIRLCNGEIFFITDVSF